MKTTKVVKKGKKEDFGKERSSSAKVVKEKRPGKPIMSQLEEDEDDVKPLRPTTNSFFDEDYDADNDDDDNNDDDNDDDDWEEGDDEDEDDDEDLEEFQKVR